LPQARVPAEDHGIRCVTLGPRRDARRRRRLAAAVL